MKSPVTILIYGIKGGWGVSAHGRSAIVNRAIEHRIQSSRPGGRYGTGGMRSGAEGRGGRAPRTIDAGVCIVLRRVLGNAFLDEGMRRG